MHAKIFSKIIKEYEEFLGHHYADDLSSYTVIKEFAEKKNLSATTVRKALITVGAYDSDKTRIIGALYRDGNDIDEIQRITGLKRATVYSYLPYMNSRHFKC